MYVHIFFFAGIGLFSRALDEFKDFAASGRPKSETEMDTMRGGASAFLRFWKASDEALTSKLYRFFFSERFRKLEKRQSDSFSITTAIRSPLRETGLSKRNEKKKRSRRKHTRISPALENGPQLG